MHGRGNRSAAMALGITLALLASGVASADTAATLDVENDITDIDRSGPTIVVRGRLTITDLDNTIYNVVKCRVLVKVGGERLGIDRVGKGFPPGETTHIRWRVDGVDPGGPVRSRVLHCHHFADA